MICFYNNKTNWIYFYNDNDNNIPVSNYLPIIKFVGSLIWNCVGLPHFTPQLHDVCIIQ